MAPFYSVKIYIKEFEKMLKKLLTFCWTVSYTHLTLPTTERV